MSAVAMNSFTRYSPTAMIDDRNDPDAPSRGAQNALQAIGDCGVGLYPHPKVLIPVAVRVPARQAAAMNKTTTPSNTELTTCTFSSAAPKNDRKQCL